MKFIYNKLNFYVACLECLCVHGIFSLWLNLYVSWNVQSIHNRCPHLEHYDFIYMHVMHVYTKSQIRYLQYANMLAEHWLILTIEKLAMHNQHLLFNNEPSYVGTTFNELQLDILTWLTFLFLFFPSFVLTNCKVQLNPMLIPAIIGGLRGGWGVGRVTKSTSYVMGTRNTQKAHMWTCRLRMLSRSMWNVTHGNLLRPNHKSMCLLCMGQLSSPL